MQYIPQIFLKRHSVRSFKNTPVSDDNIKTIVMAASLAPTARNVQPWEFIIIKDRGHLDKLGLMVSPNGGFVKEAAACIAVFCQDTKYYLEDGCAATTQALLCAAALDLGSCWIAGDKKEYAEQVREFLGLPEGYKLVSLIALGHADKAVTAPKRPLIELMHRENFSKKTPR